VDDLICCIDWLQTAGGTCLVVHPGGLSAPTEAAVRREALAASLVRLAEHARGTQVILCVENMPPGVHPGSRMADLVALVAELDHPHLALALDTGHAHLSADLGSETTAAGRHLRTTHVHDNNGKQDSHEPPGIGTIRWEGWTRALDAIGYRGPIMLECIRHLRRHPDLIQAPLLDLLRRLTTGGENPRHRQS
jgi:sugar phosphate isomerase/epimerase